MQGSATEHQPRLSLKFKPTCVQIKKNSEKIDCLFRNKVRHFISTIAYAWLPSPEIMQDYLPSFYNEVVSPFNTSI